MSYVTILQRERYKSKTVINTFIEIVIESNHKPNNFWVDQEREFYNKLMQEG